MFADGGIFGSDARVPRQEPASFRIHDPQRMSILGLRDAPTGSIAQAEVVTAIVIHHGVGYDLIRLGHNLLILHTSPWLHPRANAACRRFVGGSGLDRPFQEGQKLAVSSNRLRYLLGG